MNDSVPDAPVGSAVRRYRLPALLLAVFVVGLIVGAVIVAVFSGGTQFTVSPTTTGSTSPSGTAPTTPSGGEFRVNAACLRAVDDAKGAASALSGLSSAARNLDAAALDAIVRQVQAADRKLHRDIGQCHAVVLLPSGPSSLSPTPTHGAAGR